MAFLEQPLPPAVRRTRSGGQPPEFASVPPPAAQYVPAVRHTQPAQSSFAGHECILAWDYENLALPSSLEAGAAATRRLLELARRFGRVTQCRVYHDSAKVSGDIAAKHRSSLDALGFTIVDCPTSDKKEALDKKVLVDVALFAAATQAPRSVVLAASDGDYAYLLSRCRQLGVHCVSVRGERSAHPALAAASDAQFSWERDVLLLAAPPPRARKPAAAAPPRGRAPKPAAAGPVKTIDKRGGRGRSPRKKPGGGKSPHKPGGGKSPHKGKSPRKIKPKVKVKGAVAKKAPKPRAKRK